MQVLEPQVRAKVTGGAATAGAVRQNHGVNDFRFDASIFDSAQRCFQSEFERTLGRTAGVGGFTDADNARLVSQINQLGHMCASCKADVLNNKAATNVSLDFATKAKHE